MLYAKFTLNWPDAFGEEDENVKSLRIDRRTDDRRSEILKLT